jgi:1-acyl-sn-glycerol-3-phosphate acyltransferase
MDARNKSSLTFVNFGLKCVMLISGVKLEVNGYDNIPKDQAVLFVGNHNSFYDIIVTYPLMKRPTGYIAKKEMKKVPFLSWWMYFVNCIFLDRSDPRAGLKSVLDATNLIKNGISVFLFPEGTRSKDGKLQEFKDGGFKIATKSKCPIVPVGITGSADIFENHFPRIKSAKVTVTFGTPVNTADLSREELKEISSRIRNDIKNII